MSISTFSYTQRNLSMMPLRKKDSNKATYGRLLAVCGSSGMSGAAYFCAKAALRTGAGLVEILTPEENRVILQALLPEAIICCYDKETPDTLAIDLALSRADAIVCGCGMGVSSASRKILSHILKHSALPAVLDADALNLISKNPSLLKYAKGKIITPHPLEMSRLCGIETEQITNNRFELCRDFAERHSLVCLLKGHNTAVSDGNLVYKNTTGNSGMATAGSGDVLAGIIGGILAQDKGASLSHLEAASLGCFIHGLAGDIAAERVGEYSLIASDIIDAVPNVLKAIIRH